jgi:CheY-like chemotaxis protein
LHERRHRINLVTCYESHVIDVAFFVLGIERCAFWLLKIVRGWPDGLKKRATKFARPVPGFRPSKPRLNFAPEAAIIDIGLPDGDAWELAPLLEPGVVVAVTAGRTWADKQKSEATGVDYHLVKPLTQRDIVRLFEGLGRKA